MNLKDTLPGAGLGGGKYEPETTLVRERTGGSVVLIIVDGNRGHGFSMQATPDVVIRMPQLLRQIADDIEAMQATNKDN